LIKDEGNQMSTYDFIIIGLGTVGSSSRLKAAFHNRLVDCDPVTLNREVSTKEINMVYTDSLESKIREIIHEMFCMSI
jgi:hypothetical protein